MNDNTLPTVSDLSRENASKVSLLRDEFESNWKRWREGPPRIEDYLDRIDPAARRVLLAELVRLELESRAEQGGSVTHQEYQERFPDQTWLVQLFPGEQETIDELRSDSVSAESTTGETVSYIRDSAESGSSTDLSTKRNADLDAPPGYTILEELGRGGMGVVHKARHQELDRIVALKMIRAGADADEAELTRFRVEAEAVARLQHPNIVQIFEIGEHQGNPFFSLEFCSGGNLSDKLGENPLGATEAAGLLATLARGVHSAHQAKVLHRDLKPANVLLTEDGQPKIADFGLAKKLDAESEQTRTGAIMGTPSYMAPEQASGDLESLSPRTDVYALGTVLYACLTGRPPFRGTTSWETIRLVLESEPVSPRQLQPSTPPDLETICLKCLEKAPGSRYGSALELAEDLERFLAGEPIEARPVGPWEKATKWVNRNRVVASLLAAVMLVLVAGATVSGVLAYVADERADQATSAQSRAEESEARAIQKGDELKDKNAQLEKRRQELRVSTVLGYLRSLKSEGSGAFALEGREHEALSELMVTDDSELKLQFVRAALRSPVKTRQFRIRAKEALLATVGMSTQRRDEVDRLLLDRLLSVDFPDDQRLDVALIASVLGMQSSQLVEQTAPILARALSDNPERGAKWPLAEGLIAIVARMEPSAAATILARAMTIPTNEEVQDRLSVGLSSVVARADRAGVHRAATVFIRAMEKPTSASTLSMMMLGLSSMMKWMEPAEAARISERASALLVDAMSKSKQDSELGSLAWGLEVVSSQLASDAAGRVVGILERIIIDPAYLVHRTRLLRCLARVSVRLAPDEAARTADFLSRLIDRDSNSKNFPLLAGTLASVAGRMEPLAAITVLVGTMTKANDTLASDQLTHALATVSSQLEQNEVSRAVGILIQALQESKMPWAVATLSETLASLLTRLSPEEAAKVCARAVAILTHTLTVTEHAETLGLVSRGLAAVVPRLDPEEATRACSRAVDVLTRVLSKARGDARRRRLASALVAVADRMEPKAALAILVQTMAQVTDGAALSPLASGSRKVSARLAPVEASEVCSRAATTLIQSMRQPRTQGFALQPLSSTVSSLAKQMKPDEAARTCSEVAAVLSKVMARTKAGESHRNLTKALYSITARMEPGEAARIGSEVAALLIHTMSMTTSPKELRFLALAVGLIADRMEPDEAARACFRAATYLVQAVSNPEKERGFRSLPGGLTPVLSSISKWLKPDDAARTAKTLVRAMEATEDRYARRTLSSALAAVAVRMKPDVATAMLLYLMSRIRDSQSLQSLLGGFTAVAPRLEPDVATRTVAGLLHLIYEEHRERTERQLITTSLGSIVAQLEPEDQSRMTRFLIRPATKLTRTSVEGMAAVAMRMQPEEAMRTAALLTVAIDKARHPSSRGYSSLSQILSSVLAREDSGRRVRHCSSLVAAMAAQTISGQPFSVWPDMYVALEAPPPKLQPGQLVTLLKLYTCNGSIRWLILDELQKHYGRPFADRWDFVQFARENDLEKKLGLDFESSPTELARVLVDPAPSPGIRPEPPVKPQLPGPLATEPDSDQLLVMLEDKNSVYQRASARLAVVQEGWAVFPKLLPLVRREGVSANGDVTKLVREVIARSEAATSLLRATTDDIEPIRDVMQAIARLPDSSLADDWRPLLCLQLLQGDFEEHRRCCSELLRRYEEAKAPEVVRRLVECCSFGPCSLAEARRLVNLAEELVRVDRSGKNLISLGGALYRAGRHEEAVEVLSEASKISQGGNRLPLWQFLGLSHAALGNNEEALQWYGRVRNAYLVILGSPGRGLAKLGVSCRELETAIGASRIRFTPLASAALRLQQHGKWAEAGQALEALRREQPLCAAVHVHAAYGLQRQNKTFEALRAYFLAARLDPSLAFWPINSSARIRGYAAIEKKEWGKATEELRLAAHQPGADLWRDWYPLLLCQLQQGQLEEYRRSCAEMIRRFGNAPNPRLQLDLLVAAATGPCSKKDAEKLVAIAKRLVGNHKDALRLLRLGSALYRAGRYQEAIAALTESNTRHSVSGYSVSRIYLCMAHARSGNMSEARRCFRQSEGWLRSKGTDRDFPQLVLQRVWWLREIEQVLKGETKPASK